MVVYEWKYGDESTAIRNVLCCMLMFSSASEAPPSGDEVSSYRVVQPWISSFFIGIIVSWILTSHVELGTNFTVMAPFGKGGQARRVFERDVG